jgi:hypothetical protein
VHAVFCAVLGQRIRWTARETGSVGRRAFALPRHIRAGLAGLPSAPQC